MSGIAGLFYADGRPVAPKAMERMLGAIAHRGPDRTGQWINGHIGLGHQLLWTTPESLLESQPQATQSGDLVITADARIDNRQDLMAVLGLTQQPAEKITDSALILAAYQRWGDRAPEHLIGDFAFAIWDKRQQQLFCARDPMGVKPFYYHHSSTLFAFASEIKALLCLPDIPRRLNELKVACHLAMVFDDQAITFYRDIVRLPAAHSLLLLRHQEPHLRRYWSLDPQRELRLGSDEEYVEAFQDCFTEAVRCRLRSAFPVGTTLSGGLDSSSIACTARNLLAAANKPSLHTFSAIFPSLPPKDLRLIDERPYIDAVHASGGFLPHRVEADRLSPLIDLLWTDDEASLSPNLYMHWALYQKAQQQGVRVFLDGFDGDSTIYHGWRYLTELALTGRWPTLMGELAALATRYGRSRKYFLAHYVLKPILSESLTYLRQSLPQSWQPTPPIRGLIHPDFARQVGLADHIRTTLSHLPTTALTSRTAHWLSLTTGLYPHALELADRATARVGIEGRYPFFDRRLIELCLSLPASQKLRQGWTRSILRRAMAGVLPPEVQQRVHKSNLSPNFNRQLLNAEKPVLDRVVSHPRSLEPYVDLNALRDSHQRYASASQSSDADAINVFSAATLALWLDETMGLPS